MTIITFEQFLQSVQWGGYLPVLPTFEQYKSFIQGVKNGRGRFSSKRELAMFLAHVLHESEGLQCKLSQDTSGNGFNHPLQYSPEWRKMVQKYVWDDPSRTYFGRGYLNLTWFQNYYKASIALLGNDLLCRKPDLVAEDEGLAWESAFFTWGEVVHPVASSFEDTVQVIAAITCSNSYNVQRQRRTDIFAHIKLVLDI